MTPREVALAIPALGQDGDRYQEVEAQVHRLIEILDGLEHGIVALRELGDETQQAQLEETGNYQDNPPYQ